MALACGNGVTVGPMTATNYVPHLYSISIKGVVVRNGEVLLLKNEREEWELPGGRIEPGETPEECVAREITEETAWPVTTGPILDTWMYYINEAEKNVFIVTYGCYPDTDAEPVLSHEHKEIGMFGESEIAGLNMPEGYKRSITTWFARLRATEAEPVR
ncbi:ADP-ribose pyrophosphatase YjhB, NUDIX family [Nocardia amikacinitolerans]|uniref:ADP-ribose pyrophosphatase YjhB, NUDIX family n=2 Tax=Nocardia amikacinitolerans TaxID=756689 RepID=A0A285LYH0_9NOCA|nr:ADP-ribose pyrophosphatase YjhB, NUDIX family [Nocardia amikacinitolerans]